MAAGTDLEFCWEGVHPRTSFLGEFIQALETGQRDKKQSGLCESPCCRCGRNHVASTHTRVLVLLMSQIATKQEMCSGWVTVFSFVCLRPGSSDCGLHRVWIAMRVTPGIALVGVGRCFVSLSTFQAKTTFSLVEPATVETHQLNQTNLLSMTFLFLVKNNSTFSFEQSVQD